jgi:site-specific DNA recombinase
MIARIYIRVSTDEQAKEGFSLAAQEERCRQFIQSQGWEVDEVYRDDGYSAKDLQRPAIQRVIQDVKNKKFDVLVVYRLDRLVRSVMDLHYLLGLFDKYGIKFKSVTEVFDTTTAMGRFFITLVGAMSQWERENLSERVKMGMERRFMEGKRHGHAPFGYNLDGDRLVINQDEAEVVRWIFQTYKNHGMTTIAHRLNQKGIRTKNGSLWHDAQIYYLLTNPVYIGQIRYGTKKWSEKRITLKGDHEPIINEEEFNATQKLIAKRKNALSPKALTSDYPFSGVLYCAHCGAAFFGGKDKRKTGGHRFYYRCSGRYNVGMCDAPSISESKIEKALFDSLEIIAQDFPKPKDPPKDTDPKHEIERIEKEIERIKKRRKKWQEAFAAEAITLEELIERTKEDGEREKQLREELLKIPQEDNTPSISQREFRQAIQDIRTVWNKATREERKQLIHSIFKRIVVAKEGNDNKSKVIITDYELS